MKNYLLSGVAAGALAFTACSKKVDTGVEKDDLKPNEAVAHWAQDASAGRVASLWDSLPESYQGDVQSLARDFGAKVDSEVYDEAMKTLDSVSDLLRDKKEIIVTIMDEQSKMVGEDKVSSIKDNYDEIVALVDAIVNSDIKDAAGLKEVEISKFMGDIQDEAMAVADVVKSVAGDDASWMQDAKVDLVSEDGDNAEVKNPDPKTEENMKLKRVGKRWVPAEMAEDWDKEMNNGREALAKMEKMSAVDKQKVLGIMRTVQATAKELQETKTKEEFMAKAGKAASGFGGLF